jgi:16S rRNA (guanine966-N2)-methyltransferase
LATLHANIAMLRADDRATVLVGDALAAKTLAVTSSAALARAPWSAALPRAPCALIFLDPPYGADLVPRALAHLTLAGWIAPNALIVAETARAEPPLHADLLAERVHGLARIHIWRAPVRGP